jgi:hypothetical protein
MENLIDTAAAITINDCRAILNGDAEDSNEKAMLEHGKPEGSAC